MSRNNDIIRLRHMLDYANQALSMARGKKRKSLDRSPMLRFAVVHLLELIGEAASKISGTKRVKYRGIPWSEIVGLRNRLIHGYDAIDYDIVWKIVQKELLPLRQTLKRIIRENS